MNIFFLTLIIFVLVYLLLSWFVKTSSAKISKGIRTFTIILSIVLAVIMAFAGRYIFSLPFLLMILPLIKTKAGLTLLQFVRIWGLLRFLKNSGRFNYNSSSFSNNTQPLSKDEAYKILNLDPKKRYSINANIKATAEPKIIKSDSMYSIISVAIIDGPPR